MGLLDYGFNPMTQGLLSAGAALMDASGPSRMPVSLGQALARGMQGGMQGIQGAQQAEMDRTRYGQEQELYGMKLAAAKKAQADEEQAKTNLNQYLQSMPDGAQKQQIVQAVQMGVPMSKVWEKLNPELKAPEGMRYGAGGALEEIPGYVAMKSKIAAAGRNPAPATPYYSPVQTAQGVMAFNARTGRMEPVQVNGQNVIGAQADPNLQGAISGARTQGEAAAKRDFNMGGVSDIIGRAEAILNKGTATGSGIGNIVDAAGAAVGFTPRGAKEADELKALSGWLVAKVPRMEGPQSNYDVENYKEMAGKIGDPTLPIARRKAALDTIKGILAKYDKTALPPATGGVKFLGFE